MLHNNKITTLFFTLFISNNCNQVKIDRNALFIPSKIGQVSVIHEDNKFKVQSSTGTHEVKPWHMNKELRNIPQDQILKLLALGSSYLHVNNMEGNNEEYSLKLYHRLKGGGPITGAILYWGTKAICYGTAAAGAGAAVVATGGAAGAAIGSAAAVATSGGTMGAGIVAGAIGGAGLAGEAALGTTAIVSTAGGIASAIAVVETTAASAGMLGLSIPFLP